MTESKKAAMTMKTEVGENGTATVKLAFGNGETRTVELDRDDPLYHDFAIFGLQVKLRNATALPAGSSVEDKVKSVDALLEAFSQGEWGVKRGDGEGQPTGGLLAQALSNLSGKPLEEIRTFLTAFDKAGQAAMRADPTVAAEIARIRPVPKAKANPDVAAAMASLLGKAA